MQARTLFSQLASKRRQAGLTLIELMIGLMIGLIVIGAVLYVFLGSRLTYKYNDAIGRLQENGRIAIDMMSQDLRMTGYIGCRRLWAYTSNGQINFSDGFNTEIESSVGLPSASVDVEANGFVLPPPSDLDPRQVEDTDSIIVLAGATAIPLTGFVASGSSSITTASAVPLGPAVISDCRFDEGLSLSEPAPTGVPAPAVGFNVTTAGTTITHDGDLAVEYGPYSGITPISPVTYSVRENNDDPKRRDNAGNVVLALFRNNVELIEGVRDLCVRYGVATNSSNEATGEYVEASAVTDWQRIVAVRIELLLASVDDNTVDAIQPPLDLCGTEFSPPDRRMYKVFTATVGLRNQIVSN